MSKRSTWTSTTPLPAGLSRELVLDFLHDHEEMIDLNPLVKDRHPIPAPDHAESEEQKCVWYSITDKIQYLPGNLWSGEVSYTCAFNNLPHGLQTHCYAPMGTDIRDIWSVAGTLPGEPSQPVEIGIGAPTTGLYLREDVDLRCNFVMTSFVKKTLKDAHSKLMNALAKKARQRQAVGTYAVSGRPPIDQHAPIELSAGSDGLPQTNPQTVSPRSDVPSGVANTDTRPPPNISEVEGMKYHPQ